MSLREEERYVLVTLQLEKVTKMLAELDVQLQNSLWSLAANRLIVPTRQLIEKI